MKKKILKNIEWGILVCAILLILIGLVALYSATQGEKDQGELKKQIIWLVVSIPIVILVVFVDYETIVKISPILYGVFLLLLIAVLFTTPVNGATSWFEIGPFSFQPSEFTKIFVILVFSYVITKIQERGRDEISRPTRLMIALSVVLVPVLLIIKQPDYGTALAFLVSTILILYTAGIKKRYIITSFLLIIILVPVMYLFVLPEHAKTRIDVFLNPNLDPRGAGYNIIQSKLAIGSGQLLGMGILKGNQTQLGFLYPKTTDFIFSVIGEEMGFIAAAGIVIIYVVLIGLFEEIFFRGIIENELLEKYSSNKKEILISIIISGVVFGAVHLTNLFAGQDLLTTMMQFVQTTAIGILFGTVYYKTRNIWAMIFLHSFYDFSVLLSEVNLVTDCGYVSNVPISITAASMVASIILSLIYLLYSASIFEEKKTKIYNNGIFILIALFFISNILFGLFGASTEDYYVCTSYDVKEFSQVETHYYSYDDFNYTLEDGTIYHIYKKDNKAVLEDNIGVTNITFDIDNVDRVVVIDKYLIILYNISEKRRN